MSTALKSQERAKAFSVEMPIEDLVSRISHLFSRCDLVAGCFIWRGSTKGRGYPQFSWPGYKNKPRTHRFFYSLFHGPVPKGLFVCHRCDNPQCLNVQHMFLGTPAENTQDMVVKGRSWGQKSLVCRNGHFRDAESTRFWNRNGRHYKACMKCVKAARKRARALVVGGKNAA